MSMMFTGSLIVKLLGREGIKPDIIAKSDEPVFNASIQYTISAFSTETSD